MYGEMDDVSANGMSEHLHADLFGVWSVRILTRYYPHFRNSNDLVAVHFKRRILHVECPHILDKAVIVEMALLRIRTWRDGQRYSGIVAGVQYERSNEP